MNRLIELLHSFPQGAQVMITSIEVPPVGASFYGIISIGDTYERGVHSEEEMYEVLAAMKGK